MSSTETLTRPEISPETESLYVNEIDLAPDPPESPMPGPGDIVFRRASLRGHLLLSKMHITIGR